MLTLHAEDSAAMQFAVLELNHWKNADAISNNEAKPKTTVSSKT